MDSRIVAGLLVVGLDVLEVLEVCGINQNARFEMVMLMNSGMADMIIPSS
jgi:hypothetical protein